LWPLVSGHGAGPSPTWSERVLELAQQAPVHRCPETRLCPLPASRSGPGTERTDNTGWWVLLLGHCFGVEGPATHRIHSAASSVRGSFVSVRPPVRLIRSRPWPRMPRDSTVQRLMCSCAPAGSSLDGTRPMTGGPSSGAGDGAGTCSTATGGATTR
jgi:hypothetical protein